MISIFKPFFGFLWTQNCTVHTTQWESASPAFYLFIFDLSLTCMNAMYWPMASPIEEPGEQRSVVFAYIVMEPDNSTPHSNPSTHTHSLSGSVTINAKTTVHWCPQVPPWPAQRDHQERGCPMHRHGNPTRKRDDQREWDPKFTEPKFIVILWELKPPAAWG